MTKTSKLTHAEVAVEAEAEEVAVAAPLEVTLREEPDKIEDLRAERLSCLKRPSPPCDERHRLNA